MIMILAEKPSQARNFGKALGGMSGTYNGEDYTIVPARGHLYGFINRPEMQVDSSLKEKYQSWNLENLPWNEGDFKWKREKKEGASSVIANIVNTARNCDEICVATDDDPTGEGQLLAFEILLENNIMARKFTRMYFVDESPAEVQKAFVHRKHIPDLEKDPDYVKALYRTKWDYLSMQFTRIATKAGDGRSVLRQGRLKSAMVYLVGEQLDKVKGYKKVPFYSNKFRDENGVVYTSEDEPIFPTKDEVPNKYGPSKVVVDSKTKKKTAPGKLIDLASLSATLSSKGVKAKDVLQVYQKMYEAQVVSYPRTEDKFITPEQFNDLLPKIDAIADLVGVDKKLLTHRTPRKTHVKTGCVHGANRPGPNVPKSLSDLDKYGSCAKDIYIILAKNYLAMLAEDYEYEAQKGHLEKYPSFVGSSNIPLSMGWKAVSYDKDDEPDDDDSNKGLGSMANPFVHEGFPPKPANPTMKWLMKQLEKHDVGTGATRTSIYADVTKESKTVKYPLLKETKGKITMTQFGEMSYKLLPGTNIGNIEITEKLMKDMKLIAEGKMNPDDGLAEMAKFVREDIITMQANGKNMRKELNIMGDSDLYCSCTFEGKDARFKREYSGRRFTDEECKKLASGEELTITDFVSAKTGRKFEATGKLEYQEFKGKKFLGFKISSFGNKNDNNDDMYYKCKFNGKDARFKKVYSGHTFTEDECKKLAAGETLLIHDFVSKKGSKFSAEAKLAWQEFKGNKFLGVKLEFPETVPNEWCKHKFTKEEKENLELGNIVLIEGAISKKGNVFNVEVKFDKDESGKKKIIPLFDK